MEQRSRQRGDRIRRASQARTDPVDPGSGERLAQEIDPRLADVWAFLFQAQLEPDDLARQVGWFLRMAYLQGYEDAVHDPDPWQLYRILGVAEPGRRTTRKGGLR